MQIGALADDHCARLAATAIALDDNHAVVVDIDQAHHLAITNTQVVTADDFGHKH